MNPTLLRALMHIAQMQALASQGRDGDTMLAHINPQEARMLKERGGSGTINPKTGLPEFAEFGAGSTDTSGLGGGTSGGSAASSGGVDTGFGSGITSSGSVAGVTPDSGTAVSPGGGGGFLSSISNAISNALSSTGGKALKDIAAVGPVAASSGVGLINPLGGLLSAIVSNAPENMVPGVTAAKGLSDLMSMALGPPTGTGAAASSGPGFGTNAGAAAPPGAIDPVLQSAMMYANAG